MTAMKHFLLADDRGLCIEEISHWTRKSGATKHIIAFSMRNGATIEFEGSSEAVDRTINKIIEIVACG